MQNKIEELNYNIKICEGQKNNLQKLLNDQRNANEALMLAPQNINFLALKKNY